MEYEDRMDQIFKRNLWKHRTLRTLFNPGSAEWSETNMEQKLVLLKKILNAGEDLNMLLLEYKTRYREMNKKHVADAAEDGLSRLLAFTIINGKFPKLAKPDWLKKDRKIDFEPEEMKPLGTGARTNPKQLLHGRKKGSNG
jgi:hypothetical protein